MKSFLSAIRMTSSYAPPGGEVCNKSYQLLEAMKAWERGLYTATLVHVSLALRLCRILSGNKLGLGTVYLESFVCPLNQTHSVGKKIKSEHLPKDKRC